MAEVIVHAGAEPEIFTCHFLGWEPRAADSFVDPYETKLRQLMHTREASMSAKPMGAADAADEADAPTSPATTADLRTGNSSANSSPGKSQYVYKLQHQYTDPAELRLGIAELSKPTSELPKQVDPACREQYLDDDEFERVLGSPRKTFNAMPAWKRQDLKRAKSLF